MRVARPAPNCSPVGQGLLGQSVTPKRGLPSGPRDGDWVMDLGGAYVCTYRQERVGSIHVQELVEPGKRILLIYMKSGLSSKAEHAEKPTSGRAPRGGRSAGGRWVGASTQGERQSA